MIEVADDVRRHAKNGARFDLEEVDGFVALERNVVRGRIFKHGLHVVDGENRRTAEHAGRIFGFERAHPGHEVVGPVRVDGRKECSGGIHAADDGIAARVVAGLVTRADRAAALPLAVAALAGEVDAELAACVRINVDDGRMDLNELDGLVEIADHLFVVGHAVGRVGDENRIDARIGHDADVALANRRRGREGLRAFILLLLGEARRAEARHRLRGVALLRDGRAAHGLAHDHAAQNRGDARHRDRLLHVGKLDVVRPCVLDGEDAHHDLFGLNGKVGGGCGADVVDIAGGARDRQHVPLAVDARHQLFGDEA